MARASLLNLSGNQYFRRKALTRKNLTERRQTRIGKFSKWHVRHCSFNSGISTSGAPRANTKEFDQAQTNARVGNTQESVCRALRANTQEFDRAQTNVHDGTLASTAEHVMTAKNIRAHALAHRKCFRKFFHSKSFRDERNFDSG